MGWAVWATRVSGSTPKWIGNWLDQAEGEADRYTTRRVPPLHRYQVKARLQADVSVRPAEWPDEDPHEWREIGHSVRIGLVRMAR